jgi:hypothetical protein
MHHPCLFSFTNSAAFGFPIVHQHSVELVISSSVCDLFFLFYLQIQHGLSRPFIFTNKVQSVLPPVFQSEQCVERKASTSLVPAVPKKAFDLVMTNLMVDHAIFGSIRLGTRLDVHHKGLFVVNHLEAPSIEKCQS